MERHCAIKIQKARTLCEGDNKAPEVAQPRGLRLCSPPHLTRGVWRGNPHAVLSAEPLGGGGQCVPRTGTDGMKCEHHVLYIVHILQIWCT